MSPSSTTDLHDCIVPLILDFVTYSPLPRPSVHHTLKHNSRAAISQTRFPPKRFPEYIIVLRDFWTEVELFRALQSALPSRPCMSMHHVFDVNEVISLRSGTSRLLGVAHTIMKIPSSYIESLETAGPAWKRGVTTCPLFRASS